MYIVNTSFFVDPAVQNAWLAILKDKYIPFLKGEGCRIISFSRIISADPVDHFTYSLMTEAEDIGGYTRYEKELFAEYEKLAGFMFGERVTTFTTLMKKIEHE